MKKRFALFTFLQLVILFSARAQGVFPPASSSRELAKYIDYPVATNTGVPEISIPLYSIEFGGQQIPVVLRYHASGIKFGQSSGSVGVGWSFSPDFQISRTIRGRDDELYAMPDLDSVELDHTRYDPGYFGLPKLFNDKMARDIYLAKFFMNDLSKGAPDDHSNYPPNFQSTTLYDSEMDIFRYSLADRSGRFIFEKRNPYQVLLLDDDSRKLDIHYQDRVFNVKDDRGWAYTFGMNEYFQLAWGTGTYYPHITAFHLNHIRALNGDSLEFAYRLKQGDKRSIQKSNFVKEGCKDCLPLGIDVHTINSLDTNGTVGSREWMPEFIKFPEGSMSFSYITPPNEAQIEEITIKDNDNVIIRTINFYYTIGARHVFLDSLKILGTGEEPAVYRFDYYKTDDNGIAYDAQNLETDYWGYYMTNGNGGANPSTSMSFSHDLQNFLVLKSPGYDPDPISLWYRPLHELSPSMRFFNKMPYSQTSTMYTIKKITYPTGGFTEYLFDKNYFTKASDYPNAYRAFLGAGLRIREIVSNDLIHGSTNTMRKTYTYGDGNIEEGGGNFGYGFMINTSNTEWRNYARQGAEIGVTPNSSGTPLSWMLFNTYTFYNTYVGDMDFAGIEENPVYYAKVTEKIYSDSVMVGLTEYTFDLGRSGVNIYTGTRNLHPNIIGRGTSDRIFVPQSYGAVSLGDTPMPTSKSIYKNVQGQWKKFLKEEYKYTQMTPFLNIPQDVSTPRFRNISVSSYAKMNTDYSVGLPAANIYGETNIESFFDFTVYDIRILKRILKEKIIVTYDE